uniref:Uncharacterized protein n=1 Tax=Heterorhabditis bacteriophora TaxID=37862 RepID=A0A1I7WHA3_HETBA
MRPLKEAPHGSAFPPPISLRIFVCRLRKNRMLKDSQDSFEEYLFNVFVNLLLYGIFNQ